MQLILILLQLMIEHYYVIIFVNYYKYTISKIEQQKTFITKE